VHLLDKIITGASIGTCTKYEYSSDIQIIAEYIILFAVRGGYVVQRYEVQGYYIIEVNFIFE
jgi:hypothetical protein